jgi:hypothetical protein
VSAHHDLCWIYIRHYCCGLDACSPRPFLPPALCLSLDFTASNSCAPEPGHLLSSHVPSTELLKLLRKHGAALPPAPIDLPATRCQSASAQGRMRGRCGGRHHDCPCFRASDLGECVLYVSLWTEAHVQGNVKLYLGVLCALDTFRAAGRLVQLLSVNLCRVQTKSSQMHRHLFGRKLHLPSLTVLSYIGRLKPQGEDSEIRIVQCEPHRFWQIQVLHFVGL